MNTHDAIARLEKAGLRPPKVLTIAITDKCNLCCSHCWLESNPSLFESRGSKNAIKRLIEEFATIGGSAIRLTGGEPLLHPDWLELISAIGAAKLTVLLQSNGILFNTANIGALRELSLSQLKIQISLDGATRKSHDMVRGQGAFRQTLGGIQRLIDCGLGQSVSIFFTEMRHNLHELPELFALAGELGIGVVSSGCLVSGGRAKSASHIVAPGAEQYVSLLKRYETDLQFRDLYDNFGSVAALEWCPSRAVQGGCSFVENPYLTTSGNLYPCLMCHSEDHSVSGVFKKGLSVALVEGVSLWADLQALSVKRTSQITECQRCEFLKSCAGGCMGRAWEAYGDLFAPDDRCQQRQVVLALKEKNNFFDKFCK